VRVASADPHYHVGEAARSAHGPACARARYDLSAQRASQLARADFDAYDYILAMDRGHLRSCVPWRRRTAPGEIGLFLEAAASGKARTSDPYYGDVDGFEHVLDMVEEAAGRWFDRVEAELDPSAFRCSARAEQPGPNLPLECIACASTAPECPDRGHEPLSNHAFRATPRHFGIGIMTSGAQRSWSVIGQVESEAGDVIMTNPGEMHDVMPAARAGPPGWRIMYVDPAGSQGRSRRGARR